MTERRRLGTGQSRGPGLHGIVAALLVGLPLLGVTGSCSLAGATQSPDRVLVFAAASLQTVLDELAPLVLEAAGVRMQASYAATSVLARQIDRGAPADLFISADIAWMDYLDERQAIARDTRVDLLGNRLVLIAAAGEAPDLPIVKGFPLAEALGRGRLAVADPESVPAGRYARAALESLEVWDAVSSRLAPSDNVRAALVLVSRGETPLGVVYRSDAMADSSVTTVGTFPAGSHPPIVYPAAVTTGSTHADEARRLLAFLRTETARRVFVAHGFD